MVAKSSKSKGMQVKVWRWIPLGFMVRLGWTKTGRRAWVAAATPVAAKAVSSSTYGGSWAGLQVAEEGQSGEMALMQAQVVRR